MLVDYQHNCLLTRSGARDTCQCISATAEGESNPQHVRHKWWSGVVVKALALINEVNLRRARYVPVTKQPPKTNSAFHPYGVGKGVPASAGKAKAGMVELDSVDGWTRDVQVKLWDPLRTRTIPQRLRRVFMTRRYTNQRLPLPYKSEAVPFTVVLILVGLTGIPFHLYTMLHNLTASRWREGNWPDISVVKQNGCVCVEEKWNDKEQTYVHRRVKARVTRENDDAQVFSETRRLDTVLRLQSTLRSHQLY